METPGIVLSALDSTAAHPHPSLCYWGKGTCGCPFQVASSPLHTSILLQPQ